MAAVATTVLMDGKIVIPAETLRSKQWEDGSLLVLVDTSDGLLLRAETTSSHPVPKLSWVDAIAANAARLGLADEVSGWRALQGILSDDLLDTLEEKHRLRDEELLHDARNLQG